MAAAISSAATSGNEAAMVSADGTTIAPGVIIDAEMDVVDLAQSRQRHVDRDAVGQRVGVLAEGQQRPPLRRAAGGDPGADRIGGVQPHVGASALVGLMGGDEGAKLFEGRHRLQRFMLHARAFAALVLVGDLRLKSRGRDSPDPIGNPGAAQCRPNLAARARLRRASIICGPAAATRTAASPMSSCSTTWCSCSPSRSFRTACWSI